MQTARAEYCTTIVLSLSCLHVENEKLEEEVKKKDADNFDFRTRQCFDRSSSSVASDNTI